MSEPLGPFPGPKVKRPEKASQTLLARLNACPFSAALYLKYKGGPQTPAMLRGSIFHRFVEESVQYLRDEDEIQMPPEVAKDRIMALIAETDAHLPEHEMNVCRLLAWNWAGATAIDPECIVGLEQMLELEIGNWTIRGKLDFAEIGPFGALVRDYKTSINLPSQDEIENGARSYQGRLYSLLLLFGIPEGETLPLGTGLDECRVELAYPRYVNAETGELIGREVTWTRDQLVDFRNSVEIQLGKLEQSLESGEWHAQAGSHCGECAKRPDCPIPEQALEFDVIETIEDAENALQLHFTRDAEQRRLMRSVSAFHETHEKPIIVGDYAWDRRLQESRRIDWDAVGDGPVQPDQIKLVPSTPFRKRKVTVEEREALNG